MSQEQDNKNKQLLAAVYNGNIEKVQTFLAEGADVNARDKDGYTALIMAVEKGYFDIVELLFKAGADVNARENDNGYTALIWAVYNGRRFPILEDLLDHPKINVNARENDGNTALTLALLENYPGIAKRLLAVPGIDVTVRNNEGWTALKLAAHKGYIDVVKALIKAGADVNAKDDETGYTALIMAAVGNHTDVVEALLEAGADVNAKNKDGNTALIAAAIKGRRATVEVLLAAPDMNVDARDNDGNTALIWASAFGHTIAELLLNAGADVNAMNNEGRTALIMAAAPGNTAIVELLLAAPGINVYARDKDGRTALSLAEERGHTDIVYVIRTWGPGAYHGTGGVDHVFESSGNIERLENTVPPTYQDIVQHKDFPDGIDSDPVVAGEVVDDDHLPSDHIRSFLDPRDQMNLAAVARRFNDLPLFPYLEEDPPYADVPYAYGYKDYRNHLAVEAAVSNAAWASTVEAAGAAAAAAAGIDPDIYNFLVSLDFLDFDPLNLPPDLNAARLWIYLPAKDVGDAIARQFLLEGDMLMQRWPENGLPDAIADVAARRVQEFGGLWGAAARAARTARAEWGADTEYIRGLVNALTETFSDEESKEPVPDQQSK